uniref:CWF19-like protein 1 n=1 Tax=Plectus sambesii TaxID=2011161 RepID=A0A914WE37_9BILA
MQKQSQVKVLVAGEVRGQFDALFKRVAAVNSKAGPFDMLICVGEFFGDDADANDQILTAKFEIPLQTYILGPCSSATAALFPKESAELAPNLTYLGRKGLLNTASGLSVAYLSGMEGETADLTHFDFDSVNGLLVPVKAGGGFIGVDLLLTSQWPAQVDNFAPNRPVGDVKSSELISKVAAGLKPRYHFAAIGPHYERAPYRNHRVLQEAAQHTTRFIGLASVGNAEKAKWLYAFNVTPMRQLSRSELTEQPPNASEFPYLQLLTSLIIKEREMNQRAGKDKPQFFFDMSEPVEDNVDRGGKRRNRGDREGDEGAKRPPQPCWFCLSSPEVEKHLVVAVSDCCYLAMAKGGLNHKHALILPVGHIQSVVAAPEEVRADIDRFKRALGQMFASTGECCVFFERNYRTQHLQIQVVPAPIDCQMGLKNAFLNLAEMRGFELSVLADDQELWEVVNEGCPYFFVELPDGTRLFTRQMKNFPLQFGREVMASGGVLNIPEKVDWRACSIDKKVEEQLTKAFQKSFAQYDFTEDDDE